MGVTPVLTVNFLQFMFQFILANFIWRMLAIYTNGTPIGNAVAFLGA